MSAIFFRGGAGVMAYLIRLLVAADGGMVLISAPRSFALVIAIVSAMKLARRMLSRGTGRTILIANIAVYQS